MNIYIDQTCTMIIRSWKELFIDPFDELFDLGDEPVPNPPNSPPPAPPAPAPKPEKEGDAPTTIRR